MYQFVMCGVCSVTACPLDKYIVQCSEQILYVCFQRRLQIAVDISLFGAIEVLVAFGHIVVHRRYQTGFYLYAFVLQVLRVSVEICHTYRAYAYDFQIAFDQIPYHRQFVYPEFTENPSPARYTHIVFYLADIVCT